MPLQAARQVNAVVRHTNTASLGWSHVNTVAVFRWKDKLPSDEEVGADPATRYSKDFGEQWAYQSCLPVANAVLQAVRNLGHKTDVEAPYNGEGGWHFTIEIDQKRYSIMVLWIPKGDRRDYFAVQPSLLRGCLASLFLARPPESSLRPVCDVLQDALGRHPQMADLEWGSEF
jgi:hypothetical protein